MPNLPTYEYLIGQKISSFGDKLPRSIDVLRHYFHFEKRIEEKEKISQLTHQIQGIYQRVGISTIHSESIRSKLKRTITSAKKIIETRKSNSALQKQKELEIVNKLLTLFEITQNENALNHTLKEFLIDQRTHRQMLVSSLSVRFINSDQPLASTSSAHVGPQQGTNHSTLPIIESDEITDDDISNFDDPGDFDDSPDFVPSDHEKNRKKLICENDIKELSKCTGSYRTIEKAISIGIKSAGGNPNDFSISRTTLCDHMNKYRSKAKSYILNEIAECDEKVVIHFDGKSFAKINQKHIGKDSRVVVLCHTKTKSVPLGIPILNGSDAITYCNEVIGLCENFNLSHRVVGISCDTTAVNTGEYGGVCVLFENEVNQEVLNLMCRHHIFETILSYAFTSTFGVVDAPTTTLVDILKTQWSQIKSRGFRYLPCEPYILEHSTLRNLYIDAKRILINHSRSKFVRDDYAELTDLCLKFFGVETKKQFMVPSSNSKARWMSKPIYCLKIYLFREEMELDGDFEQEILQFVLFVALIYCKHWNRCTNAVDAPINDMELIDELQQYSEYNAQLANAVLNAFENHLWYLGEELVILSLFSEKVSVETKNMIALRLASSRNLDQPRSTNSKRLRHYMDGMQLPDLVTQRSRLIFLLLEIEPTFLLKNAQIWNSDRNYRKVKKMIQDLIVVVNDPAERALQRANHIIKNQRARSELHFQNMFTTIHGMKQNKREIIFRIFHFASQSFTDTITKNAFKLANIEFE